MTKSYKNVRLQKNRVYSVEQLMKTYSVTANTVSNWVKEGLQPSDDRTPYLFRGAVVTAFHTAQRQRRSEKLSPDQFKCWTCQSTVAPKRGIFSKFYAQNGRPMLTAFCPDCAGKVQKITSETDCDKLLDCRNPNSPKDCLHEDKTAMRGGIGTREVNSLEIHHSANDRIIYSWQTFAEGFSDKTVVRHLSAIRYFEDFLSGKDFSKLTTNDFAAVRADIKRRANPEADDSMSASTIKHTISHIAAFFDWLIVQNGYRRVPRDFKGYLSLPRAILAKSAQTKQKDFPSIEEAEELLKGMPSRTFVDLRARAIFALAFLGALRADTLVSLQLGHIQVEKRLIIQDASKSRTKAGKSLNISWFRIPAAFEETVVDWVERLRALYFDDADALFPDTKFLKHKITVTGQEARVIPFMSTTHAVTDAFTIACRHAEHKYTPHSAKHAIGAERDKRPLTHQERKAWSLNMGHDTEQITERHYGTMSDEQRFEVLENIGVTRATDAPVLTDQDKIAFVDEILARFGKRS